MIKRSTGITFTWLMIFGMLTLCSADIYGQRYTFTHYDIEDGLVQSQVNRITEDRNHRILLATLGGMCRFDGKEFFSVTKEHGLKSNFILSLLNDSKGKVWMGTTSGLSVWDTGKVRNFQSPVNMKRHIVTNIVEDRQGRIWALMNYQLCRVKGTSLNIEPLSDSIKHSVTALSTSPAGELYAAIYQKGIYRLINNRWQPVYRYAAHNQSLIFNKIYFDKANPQVILLLNDKGIFRLANHQLQAYYPSLTRQISSGLLSIQQDQEMNLWIGSGSGAYRIKSGKLLHLNASNGFTDQAVPAIYKDASHNLWLSTAGSGLFKYEGDDYVTYNHPPGRQSNMIVMSIAKDRSGNILLGTDGLGLLKFNGQQPKKFWPVSEGNGGENIQSLLTDKAGVTWIGTHHTGLWRMDNNKISLVSGTENQTISAIAQGFDNSLWIASPLGCFYMQKDVIKHVNGINSFCAALLPLSKDSVLVGGLEGLRLVVNHELDKNFKVSDLSASAIYCMFKYNKYLLIGTGDRGIVVVDPLTKKYKRYTVKDGLNSDIIYSLTTDKHGVIWAGTGRGVNRLLFDIKTMTCTVLDNTSDKSKIVEANQNAILYDNDKVWIGTTKGVSIYDANAETKQYGKPHLIIQNVRGFCNAINTSNNGSNWSNGTPLTSGAKLAYYQNHITISFLGVYLNDPGSVYYQYKLIGLDTNYSRPVKYNLVDYPALPPGNYTFAVRAGLSKNDLTAAYTTFSFVITPPFYQTLPFRIAVILLLIFTGILIQYYYNRKKLKQRLLVEAVRNQEKINIRQQTAEDFHDDLGNKLTRITILSEILDSQLEEKEEQKHLVQQIKQNVDALYKGTKDILWALDPKSDNLYEVLLYIKDFGNDLFQDTAINFNFSNVEAGTLAKIKLPMEYCRNLTMICKELLNNVLRHANAANVEMNVIVSGQNLIKLTVSDDGKGFNAQNTNKGRGLANIDKRARRINGEVVIRSDEASGTNIELNFIVPERRRTA